MEKEKLEKKEEIKSKKMEYTELSQFVTRIGSLVQTNYIIGNFTTEFPIYVQRKWEGVFLLLLFLAENF